MEAKKKRQTAGKVKIELGKEKVVKGGQSERKRITNAIIRYINRGISHTMAEAADMSMHIW